MTTGALIFLVVCWTVIIAACYLSLRTLLKNS